MKIDYNDKIIIFYINKDLIEIDTNNKKELENYLKKILVLIKKKGIPIVSGLYVTKIYINNLYGLVAEMENIEELEFFKDMIDLKIIIFDNSKFYLKFDEYFIIKEKSIKYYDNSYYIDIEQLSSSELISLADFYHIIYGEEQEYISKKGKILDSLWKK